MGFHGASTKLHSQWPTRLHELPWKPRKKTDTERGRRREQEIQRASNTESRKYREQEMQMAKDTTAWSWMRQVTQKSLIIKCSCSGSRRQANSKEIQMHCRLPRAGEQQGNQNGSPQASTGFHERPQYGFHGLPRASTSLHGPPRASTGFHGLPRASTVGFHGLPRASTVGFHEPPRASTVGLHGPPRASATAFHDRFPLASTTSCRSTAKE